MKPRDMMDAGAPADAAKAETPAEQARREAREITTFGFRAEEIRDRNLQWPKWSRIDDPDHQIADPRDKEASSVLSVGHDAAKLSDGTYALNPDPYTSKGSQRKQHYIIVEQGAMWVAGLNELDKEAFKAYAEAIVLQISKHSSTLNVELGTLDTLTLGGSHARNKLMLYLDLAQQNNLEVTLGPKTQAFLQSMRAEDRKPIDDALAQLHLNRARANLITAATQDFEQLNSKVKEQKPWEPPAAEADKEAWMDAHIQSAYAGKADLTHQEKADAINKQLGGLQEALKQVTQAQAEVTGSLRAYGAMLAKPATIDELPTIDLTSNSAHPNRGFFRNLKHAWREAGQSLGEKLGVVEEQGRKLTDPTNLIDRIRDFNERVNEERNERGEVVRTTTVKASREALLNSLDKKQENLERHQKGLEKEIKRIEHAVKADPAPVGEPAIAARKKLETQLETMKNQLKSVEKSLAEMGKEAKKAREEHDTLPAAIESAKVRVQNEKAAADAASARLK